MIRALLLILGFAAAGVFLAQLIKQKGAGYVLIYFNHYSFETSLGFLCAVIVVAWILLWAAYKLISFVLASLWGTGQLAKRHKIKKQKNLQAEGLLAYNSEHWHDAGKKLYQSAEIADKPFVSYLMSAKAYMKLNDFACAKDALKKAQSCQAIDAVSLKLTAIDMALAQGSLTEAKLHMDEALKQYPKNPVVLLKASEFYDKANRPEGLTKALPQLEKQHLLQADQVNQLKVKQMKQALRDAVKSGDAKAIDKVYKKANGLRQNPECYLAYFEALKSQQDMPALMDKVEKQLKHEANGELLSLYADIAHDKERQFAFLKQLEANQGETADLDLALGRVAKALGNKEDAEAFFKAAVTTQGDYGPALELVQLQQDPTAIQPASEGISRH